MNRKPLEGQKTFPFMAEKRRTAKPRLTIVQAEDQPAKDQPKPMTKTRRRLPKAG